MRDRTLTMTPARAPIRANGVRRRDAILNAATKIISESGIASLTLHATARQANASIGSIYHFFSDKDQLVSALRDRHRQAMTDILSSTVAITPAAWVAMTSNEVIDALFGRPIQYYSSYPWALELQQVREGQVVDAFMAVVETVMEFRFGKTRGQEVAKMLFAISTGTLSFVLDVQDTSQRALVANIPAVLKAYLAVQEGELSGARA